MDGMSTPARVIVFDTTLRDGEQAPGYSLDVTVQAGDGPGARRPRRGHHRGGVPDRVAGRLGSGAPDCGGRAAAGDRGARAHARRRTSKKRRSRCVRPSGRASTRSSRPRICTSSAKLRMTRDECLDSAVSAVKLARRFTDDVEFSAEDATRSDRDFLCRVIEGGDRRRLHDGQPARHGRLRDARRAARVLRGDHRARPERRPRGLQHALPQRSRARGRQQPRGDPGRRAPGRVLDQRHRRARRQRVARRAGDGAARAARSPAVRHRRSARRRCSRPASCSRRSPSEPVQANKAIVGRNAFAHEAGIHQDGVLKDARTYEIMKPEDVGQSVSSRLVLGRHSGRHAVQSRCETLGFTLTPGRGRRGLPRRHLARRAPQGDRRRRPPPHRRSRAHAGVGRRRREHGARRNRRLRTRGVDQRDFRLAEFKLPIEI